MLDDSYAPAALARFDGTQQSGSAPANHDRVESQSHYPFTKFFERAFGIPMPFRGLPSVNGKLAVDTIRFASSCSGEVRMFVPLTPIRCLHRAVDLFGKRIGLVSGARQFTYTEFGERCERLATALSKEGISHGDRIAYLSFNNHQLLEGYFGVVQARSIVMPLNVRLSPFELTNILNHSGAR